MFRGPVDKKHLIMTLKSPLNFIRRKQHSINLKSLAVSIRQKFSNNNNNYDTDSTSSSDSDSFPMEQFGSPMSREVVLSFFKSPGAEFPFAAYNVAFSRLTLYCPFGLQGRGICGSSFSNGPYSAEYEWEMLQHIKDTHGVDVCGLDEDNEWLCSPSSCAKCRYLTRIPTLLQRHTSKCTGRREVQWV